MKDVLVSLFISVVYGYHEAGMADMTGFAHRANRVESIVFLRKAHLSGREFVFKRALGAS